MFKYSRPSIVFADSDNVKTVEEALHELNMSTPIYVFGDQKHNRNVNELFVETGTDESAFIPPSIGDAMKQIAVIICSSGTTGLSKGVSVSYSSVLNNMLATYVNFYIWVGEL